MGMVFQSYAIWPHMTVFENVAFPLQELRVPRAETRERVMAMLSTVGLGDLHARPAPMLSGGQQQRVALARALVSNPQVLLLDEPLSNLDARLREEMRFELREMQAKLGITSIFVTHDQAEAMTLSDRIVVMNAGRIEQEGSPEDVYQRPRTRFVMDFLGRANHLPARIAKGDDGNLVAEVEERRLRHARHRQRELERRPGSPAGVSTGSGGGAGGRARRRLGRRGAVVGLRERPRRVRGGDREIHGESDRPGRRAAPARGPCEALRVAPSGADLAAK